MAVLAIDYDVTAAVMVALLGKGKGALRARAARKSVLPGAV